MLNTHFEVEPITPAIGAEISGLILSKPIPASTLAELRSIWLERKVLCFKDQQLSPAHQLAFTRQFGEADKYPFLDGIEGNPFVAPVLKLPEDKINFGGVWHSDTAYLDTPAAGASLYALEIPPVGGDTIFCNAGLAYRTLPQETRKALQTLTAINTSSKAAVAKTRNPGLKREKHCHRHFVTAHPAVRVHPETNELTLYVNEAHTIGIEQWSEDESHDLLGGLFKHLRQPEFQCRIRWQPNMVVLWDNRSTQHYPVNDYHGFRRLLHRVSIKGDRPKGLSASVVE